MQEKIQKLKSLKLLFVEDEPDLIEIITDTLKKLNADFLTASNGKEALSIMRENSDISAIVTDINMPVMNGIDMISKLRDEGNQIPIVVMSAHTEEDYKEKARNLGVEHYLLKPFDFIRFIELITDMDIKK